MRPSADGFRTLLPSLTVPIDEQYRRLVVEGAVRLLEETGIKQNSPYVRRYLSQYKELRFEGGRVCFRRKALHEFIDALRSQPGEPAASTSFSQGPPWQCLNWADAQGGVVRPAKAEDLARAVRFLDAYGIPGDVPPVAVSGYPPASRDLHCVRICMENSPRYGAPTSPPSESELELYKRMSDVVRRPIWVLAMLINNPMSYDDAVLEFVIRHVHDEALAIEMTGGMPCAGSTSPLVFPAAHMQGLAEDLAACLFMRFVTGRYFFPEMRSDPFHMKWGTYDVGGPEYNLLDLVSRHLFAAIFGRKRQWGYFLSMSKWPDQQAAHERSTACWTQALAGAVHFKGSGQLSSDEVLSLEQVVIDRSILKGAERVCRGLKWRPSLQENLDIVGGGLARGHFLEHETTFAEYREFYCERELFAASNLGQWNDAGAPTVLQEASKIVEQTLAKSDFRRSKEEIAELRSICAFGDRRERLA